MRQKFGQNLSSPQSPKALVMYLPLNYRGISLLSCVGKIYSGILNNRLSFYLENLCLLSDEQNGFRKGRSSEDHVFVLNYIVKKRLNTGESTFVAFIDMAKAFDCVDRNLLLYKLLMNGIDGYFYKAIKCLLSNTISQVKVNNIYTDFFTTTSGFRQGYALSPTLFSMFCNDLIVELNELGLGIHVGGIDICSLVYADDIAIMADSEDKLQIMIDHIYQWCCKWRLKLNIDKSQVIHFRKKNVQQTDYMFKVCNANINITAEYRYLGIIFDEFLNFNSCAETLSKAASRALGGVISKFKQFKNVGFRTFSKLYQAAVVPVMDYCASVWGYRNTLQCTNIQNNAVRYFLGVHKKAPIAGLQGEVSWVTPSYRQYLIMVSLWNRFSKMSDTHLTKIIFRWDVGLCKNNWSSDIKKVLCDIERPQWFDPEGQFRLPLQEAEGCIVHLMNNVWKNDITVKPKLRTYVKIKNNCLAENYLDLNITRHRRSLIAQIRLGILPLEIEVGRFRGIAVDQRLCKCCNNNVTENEFHFICICPQYQHLRDSLYGKFDFSHDVSDEDKFKRVMSTNFKCLVEYLDHAWNARTNILYN